MILVETVEDFKDSLNDLYFDLGVFASGYENRCTHIISKLDIDKISSKLILGFNEYNGGKQRALNDKFFKDIGLTINAISDEDDIYELFNEINFNKAGVIKIFIDYSSMSRNWYNAVISWFKYQENIKNDIEIYFGYSVGSYESHFEPIMIKDIVSIPGLEGSDIFNEKSVALFGIGYEGDAAFSVYDQLEPDILHLFSADANEREKSLELNRELIKHTNGRVEKIPINSVETGFRAIGEMVSGYINNSHITIVPMGPKPLSLASLLICHRFSQITCLHVLGKRKVPFENVNPTGEVVVSKVIFKPQSL